MVALREFEGATLQEALVRASETLGIPEPELHFEILDTGRRGLFGLGVRNVRIRVECEPPVEAAPPAGGRERAEPGEPAARGRRGRAQQTDSAPSSRRGARGGRERREGRGERNGQEERAPARSRGRGGNGRARSKDGGSRPEGQHPSGRRRRGNGRAAAMDRGGSSPGLRAASAPAVTVEEGSPVLDRVRADIQRMFDLMSVKLTVRAIGGAGGVRVELDGEDRELLLQKDAELLGAVQFLVGRMARRAWPGAGRIQLTCDGRGDQRDSELVELAREVAQQVSRTGQAKRLEAMNPYERRLVHVTVREFDGLTTRSEGDGFLKKVRIAPK